MSLNKFVKSGLDIGIRFYNLEKPLGEERMTAESEIVSAIKNNNIVRIHPKDDKGENNDNK